MRIVHNTVVEKRCPCGKGENQKRAWKATEGSSKKKEAGVDEEEEEEVMLTKVKTKIWIRKTRRRLG